MRSARGFDILKTALTYVDEIEQYSQVMIRYRVLGENACFAHGIEELYHLELKEDQNFIQLAVIYPKSRVNVKFKKEYSNCYEARQSAHLVRR